MLSVRQRCYVKAEMLKRPVVQLRHASYSKEPLRKTGSLDDLVYNQAQLTNKLHLLEPGIMKKAPGTYTRTKQQTDEAFPIPVHRFPFEADKVLPRGDTGSYQGYRIQYEEILPRCKGKMQKLEWNHLTEEDRFTRRNHVMKNLIKMSTKQKYGDFGGFQVDPMYIQSGPFRRWMIVIGAWVLFYFTCEGTPGSNHKMMNNAHPDDQSKMEKGLPIWFTMPFVKEFVTSLANRDMMALFPTYGAPPDHEKNQIPLWTEHDAGLPNLQNLSADTMNSIYTNFFTSYRDHSIIGPVPSATFRETHELYHDGAEGPDKIGHYNVKSWKTGESDSNPTSSGMGIVGLTRIFHY